MRTLNDISLKERRTVKLSDFRGVDFTSSPLNVRADRASSMRNLICEGGVNQKRKGWKQLLKIERGGVSQRINGVFEYSYKGHRDTIVHAGARFYRVKEVDGKYSYEDITLSSSYERARCDASLLLDERSQSFFQGGRLYIIGCGDYLVYGSWDGGVSYELRRVYNNEDTYIPTTSININDAYYSSVDTRAVGELINILSSKRKNTLVGNAPVLNEDGSIKEERKNGDWYIDSGKIDEGTTVEIVIETLYNNRTPVTITLTNNGEDKTKLYCVGYEGSSLGSPTGECGTIYFGTGQISINGIVTTPQSSEKSNITVTFERANEAYFERIRNCKFGVLFGIDGMVDRLFLSGNEEYPNSDFFSEIDTFSYFPDQNDYLVGSDAAAIKGYLRLSDSTLAILKEEAAGEASVYVRTGYYTDEYDEDGEIIRRDVPRFPSFPGNSGEGAVSAHTTASLAGDNIFLSKEGVFAMALSEGVKTTSRYARERSRTVIGHLKTHKDLSDAAAIVYNNRYYLAIDGDCYIADSRYRHSIEDSVDGSYQYEWWFWDNIPARAWAILDGVLCFGTSDGRLCTFDDEYTDRTYQYAVDGSFALDVPNNKIDCIETLGATLSEGDKITFLTDGLYALVSGKVVLEGGKILEGKIDTIHNDIAVYADEVGDSGLTVGQKYYICDVDYGSGTYSLKDEDGARVDILDGGFNLYRSITGEELFLADVTGDSFRLRAYREGEILMLSGYNASLPSGLVADISHEKNVVAEFYTPVLDLGTNESSKTLLKMTVSSLPEVSGKLSFGYETRNVEKLVSARGINKFSFENFSFENFSFDTGFANSYSVRRNERNFNFIMFRFVSDNSCNCAVNSITIIYKINRRNRGVR